MPPIAIYLLKLTISLSVAWLFYRLVLRSLTFYSLNRWYLLGYGLLSFTIPFVDIDFMVPVVGETQQPLYIQLIPVVGNYVRPTVLSAAPVTSISPWSLVLPGLLTGIAVLLIRAIVRWSSLARIKNEARLLSSDNGFHIYRVDQPITPFSFGRSVFINPRLHTESEWEEIILHEYVHIRQRHTIDILLAEVIAILNWYNPFAWALRHSIRQNLEFIADQQVLDNGVDKKGYQYHLLKVVGHPRYRLANNFNFSSLKKRIIMMNKIRSARLHLLRFLFLLPLLTVILLAFRTRYPHILHGKNSPILINAAGIVISLPDKKPLAGVAVREKNTGLQTTTDANGYFKLRIPVKADSVRIHLDFTKQGFEAGMSERFWPAIKSPTGFIDVEALPTLAPHENSLFFVAPGFHRLPADPGYVDAKSELQRVLTENEQLNHQKEVQLEHPDVGLFYVTEDHQRCLVIYRNGSVDRYGYPGTPSLAAMQKKYGVLPWMGPEGANTNRGYLDHWAAISAQAEKEFHPTTGNPKAIIFPGDSRVIAVDDAGRVRVYDMDNTVDPKERPGFEKLYGKLPACVPETGTVPPVVSLRSPMVSLAADTVPKATSGEPGSFRFPIDTLLAKPDLSKVLYILDGQPQEHFVLSSLNPHDIASVNVLGADQAVLIFGERARYGAVAILTKNYAGKISRLMSASTHPNTDPLS